VSNDSPRHPVLHYLRRVHADAPGPGVADAELLRRFAAGRDEAAFELIVWRHGAMVLRVCRGVLRDARSAEDAFQATFLALARKAAAVARLAAPAGWLYRVARHVALKVRTADLRRTAREAVQVPRPDAPPADTAAESAELAALLHEEVDRLATRYRTPVVLCYLEGKTHEEAARELGWPKGTVAGRLARARDLLKRRLTRRGVAFPAAGLAALAGASADASVTGVLAAATARAAAGYAAGGAATNTSVRLANGVLHAMLLKKITTAVLACLAAGLLVAGAGVISVGRGNGERLLPPAEAEPEARNQVADKRPADPPVAVDQLVVLIGRRLQSIIHLKQLVLAVHNYDQAFQRIPHDVADKKGRPLLSWRVAILPFVEEEALFSEFKFDEPWDSDHNKKLLVRMPRVFRAPGQPAGATDTFYQGFAGAGTVFEPGKSLRIVPDVLDGSTNTLLCVEAGAAVPWTKPEDVAFDPGKPLPKLGGVFPHVINAVFLDGAAFSLRKDFKDADLRAAITRNGGENFDRTGLQEPPARLHGTEAVAAGRKPGNGPYPDDAEVLRADNDRLRELIAKADDQAVKARAELEWLRARDGGGRVPAKGLELALLAARNTQMIEALARKQLELEQLCQSAAPLRPSAAANPDADKRPAGARSVADDLVAAVRQRLQSLDNLKQLTLAAHNHADTYQNLPENIKDAGGRPLLSWRVAVLPFFAGSDLYPQFRLDEPWDSNHNKKLLARMPRVFRAPGQSADATDTFYQAFAGPGTALDPAKTLKMPRDFPDGLPLTLHLVEAGTAVPWTKPEDIPYTPGKPLPKLGGVFPHVTNASFMNGATYSLRKDVNETALRAAITRNGMERVDLKELLLPPARAFALEVEAASRKSGKKVPYQEDADALAADNDRLREQVAATDGRVAQERAELERSRDRADLARAKEKPVSAEGLSFKNSALMEAATRKQSELEELRAAIEQLRKKTGGEAPSK
jgi:RNA polymerase sigma factor (sigma-70 family)